MEAAVLHAAGLSVRYGPVHALSRVSVSVPDGAVTAVLGGNGAGKSTLLRALSGTLRFHGGAVTEGNIEFGETRLTGRSPAQIVAAGVVQVPEGRQVFARMTVADNLRAGSLGSGLSRTAQRRARERVLELFPVLADRAQQRAGLLSGGEQQMLAMGRALMAGPRLLLLDEPSLGLAPIMAARIGATIREINAQGTTVLLVEQNAALALGLATHAVVLENGHVALSGTAADLSDSDEVRRRYLGVADADAAADAVAADEREPGAERPALGRWSA